MKHYFFCFINLSISKVKQMVICKKSGSLCPHLREMFFISEESPRKQQKNSSAQMWGGCSHLDVRKACMPLGFPLTSESAGHRAFRERDREEQSHLLALEQRPRMDSLSPNSENQPWCSVGAQRKFKEDRNKMSGTQYKIPRTVGGTSQREQGSLLHCDSFWREEEAPFCPILRFSYFSSLSLPFIPPFLPLTLLPSFPFPFLLSFLLFQPYPTLFLLKSNFHVLDRQ